MRGSLLNEKRDKKKKKKAMEQLSLLLLSLDHLPKRPSVAVLKRLSISRESRSLHVIRERERDSFHFSSLSPFFFLLRKHVENKSRCSTLR